MDSATSPVNCLGVRNPTSKNAAATFSKINIEFDAKKGTGTFY